MSEAVERILAEAELLSKPERIELARYLMTSLEACDLEARPSEELLSELRRRLAEHDADPSTVLTQEQLMTYVRRPRH